MLNKIVSVVPKIKDAHAVAVVTQSLRPERERRIEAL
jgi:hypothetical protein